MIATHSKSSIFAPSPLRMAVEVSIKSKANATQTFYAGLPGFGRTFKAQHSGHGMEEGQCCGSASPTSTLFCHIIPFTQLGLIKEIIAEE